MTYVIFKIIQLSFVINVLLSHSFFVAVTVTLWPFPCHGCQRECETWCCVRFLAIVIQNVCGRSVGRSFSPSSGSSVIKVLKKYIFNSLRNAKRLGCERVSCGTGLYVRARQLYSYVASVVFNLNCHHFFRGLPMPWTTVKIHRRICSLEFMSTT